MARSMTTAGLALSVSMLMLTACGTAPELRSPAQGGDDPAPEDAASAPVASFEKKQRERAQQFVRQSRWADAAIAWEVLTVLRPEVDDYRERLAEARRQIATGVADRLQRAAQAQRRGDSDVASLQYLAALGLQPDNPQAAEALRNIERERNRRNYVGKHSRITLTRRAMSDAEAQVETAAEGAPRVASRERQSELEHASLMATQGEFKDAIALLEGLNVSGPRSPATTRLLANVYYQQGLALAATDRPAAVRSLERAVALDPKHARAKARLAALNKPASAAPAASSNTRSKG